MIKTKEQLDLVLEKLEKLKKETYEVLTGEGMTIDHDTIGWINGDVIDILKEAKKLKEKGADNE